MVAQLAGAAAGAGLLRLALSEKIWKPTSLGATLINPAAKQVGFTTPKALLLEAIMTFALVLVVFGTAIDPRGAFKSIAGFGIGLVVTADILVGGILTGASMNPARSFGPALLTWTWTDFWVYILGPVAGAVIAAEVYWFFFLRPQEALVAVEGEEDEEEDEDSVTSAEPRRRPRGGRALLAGYRVGPMSHETVDDSLRPVYLDGAAAMPLLPEAEAAASEALTRFADPEAGHGPGRAARAVLEHARAAIAESIGADPDELILTTSGSHANALAVLGMVPPGPGRIVVTTLEHASLSEAARATGLEVVEVGCDDAGAIDMDRFAAEVAREGTVLASVHHGSPDVGTMQSVAECARIARAAGVLFHTDACQTLPHLPLDARGLGVDLLTISSRKAYGPSGAGALFARRGLSPDPLLRGGRRRSGGTAGLAALAGMAAALTALRPRIPDLAGNLWTLSQRLREGLVGAGRVLGHATWRVPHIVSVAVADVDRETLFMTLEDRGIQAGEPATDVLARAGLVRPGEVVVRFGLTADTTADDVDRVLDVPDAVAARGWGVRGVAQERLATLLRTPWRRVRRVSDARRRRKKQGEG